MSSIGTPTTDDLVHLSKMIEIEEHKVSKDVEDFLVRFWEVRFQRLAREKRK